jgi:hypothetical protein
MRQRGDAPENEHGKGIEEADILIINYSDFFGATTWLT